MKENPMQSPRMIVAAAVGAVAATLFVTALWIFVARTQIGRDAEGDCLRAGNVWVQLETYRGKDHRADLYTGCFTKDEAIKIRGSKPK